MDYYHMEDTLQVLFARTLPLSQAQCQHLGQLCVGVLLAGSTHLTRIARWLQHDTQQDSRVQWLRRLLASPFLSQSVVYQPLVQHALREHHVACLHLIMDRTPLRTHQTDLLSLSLNFRKHAIPLGWHFMAHGMSDYALQTLLLERCRPLLPAGSAVVFHGDNEFASVPLMQYVRHLGWDFCVGQSRKNYYRPSPDGVWQPLSSLPVTKRWAVYLSHMELTKQYAYGPLNLFTFYQAHFSNRQRKRDITYCATSLPITPSLRRIGHRRWGIECCFKDFKSAGWNLHLSDLTHPKRREGLLVGLSFAYLWTTCLGRWLCKVSKRQVVDAKGQRHLSLFRIGWDWLVHQYQMDLPCPTLLTLYQ